MSERVVLTMKWGDVFPPSYVNRLFSAVSANLVDWLDAYWARHK